MAKGTRQRRGKSRTTRGRRKIATGRPSLLILDCDRESLPEATASFGAELETAARTFVPRARTVRIRVGTTAENPRSMVQIQPAGSPHRDQERVLGPSSGRGRQR